MTLAFIKLKYLKAKNDNDMAPSPNKALITSNFLFWPNNNVLFLLRNSMIVIEKKERIKIICQTEYTCTALLTKTAIAPKHICADSAQRMAWLRRFIKKISHAMISNVVLVPVHFAFDCWGAGHQHNQGLSLGLFCDL